MRLFVQKTSSAIENVTEGASGGRSMRGDGEREGEQGEERGTLVNAGASLERRVDEQQAGIRWLASAVREHSVRCVFFVTGLLFIDPLSLFSFTILHLIIFFLSFSVYDLRLINWSAFHLYR